MKVKRQRNYKAKAGVCPKCAQRLMKGQAECPVCGHLIPKGHRVGYTHSIRKRSKKKTPRRIGREKRSSARGSLLGIFQPPESYKVSGGLPGLGKRR